MSRDETLPEGFEALALSLAQHSAPPGLRKRLFAEVSGPKRFLPFLDRLAAHVDLPAEAAQVHLDSIDNPVAWDPLCDGVRFRDFEGGPGIGAAHGGLIRMNSGAWFPKHRHLGDEHVLVLQGVIEDHLGRQYQPGDRLSSGDGSEHSLRCVSDVEAIFAVTVIALQFDSDE